LSWRRLLPWSERKVNRLSAFCRLCARSIAPNAAATVHRATFRCMRLVGKVELLVVPIRVVAVLTKLLLPPTEVSQFLTV